MKSIWNRITGFYYPPSPNPKERPRLGLSIDSDNSPESDKSFIEEGLPLWTTTTTASVPSHLFLPSAPNSNNNNNNSSREQQNQHQHQHKNQILPRRGATLSLDSDAPSSGGLRAQKLLNHPSFLSLPVLPSNTNTDSTKHSNNECNQRIRLQQKPQDSIDDVNTSFDHNNQNENYIVIPTRLFKLLLASMAMLMIGLSSSNEIIEQPVTAKTIEFPDYILTPPPPVYTSKPNYARSHRSNLALARQQQSRPVFDTTARFPMSSSESSILLDQSSLSSDLSWISWIGGVGLFLIALETGWKGYQKSKYDAEQERRL